MTWSSDEWDAFEQLPYNIKVALFGSVLNHKPSTILHIYKATNDLTHTLRQIEIKDNSSIDFFNFKYLLKYNKPMPHVAANVSPLKYVRN